MFRARNLWSTYRARLFISLAALIMLGAACSQATAADCVDRPNLRQADGHWYYRIDRTTHHRCWYLQREAQSAGSPPAEHKLTLASVPSSISSFFADWKGSGSTGSQQNVAMAAVPPEPSSAPTTAKKDASAAHSRRLAMSERPAPPLRSHQVELEHASHQEHQQQQQLDSGQREELFEDFLRWSVRQY